MRSDLSKMQVWRQTRGSVDLWLVVVLGIARQFVLHEVFQQPKGLARASAKRVDWPDRAVEIFPTLRHIGCRLVVTECQSRRLVPLRPSRTGFPAEVRNCSRRPCNRGRMIRAAYCSFSSSFDGTITSASTVQNGTVSFFAARSRHDRGSRIGFSSPTTSEAFTSSQKSSKEWSGIAPQHKSNASLVRAFLHVLIP